MILVSGTSVEEMEFTQKSLEVAFQNRTIELDPGIPSKGIACAMECFDDPKCLAYDFDQISKCALMIHIVEGTPGTTTANVFSKPKGKDLRTVRQQFIETYMYLFKYSSISNKQNKNTTKSLF